MNTVIVLSMLLAVASAQAEERFTPEQREARFYSDLGPKELDVTTYPKEQRDNYTVFAKTCSQCHTLARTLNSPLVAREDWRRFIKRMYQKTKSSAGTAIGKESAEAAIDFLAYDAKVRKVQDKAGFETKTRELKALFAEVRAERSRLQIESDKKKVQEPAPYTGGK